tara:strand:+ start:32 stop:256 length:225 start_codon:yes stop_codon:yes gene_type:complete
MKHYSTTNIKVIIMTITKIGIAYLNINLIIAHITAKYNTVSKPIAVSKSKINRASIIRQPPLQVVHSTGKTRTR